MLGMAVEIRGLEKRRTSYAIVDGAADCADEYFVFEGSEHYETEFDWSGVQLDASSLQRAPRQTYH